MHLVGVQISHYRLQKRVGGGGAGEVYLAEDVRHAQRIVAVKVVHSVPLDLMTDEIRELHRLFKREILAVIQLDHERILPLYDAGEERLRLPSTNAELSLLYLVMPYRPDGSLADWLQKHPAEPLMPEIVAHFIYQAAEALQHAHDRHIIHMDIKPSNFLVRMGSDPHQPPDLFLADFGNAKITDSTSVHTQNIRGTPFYMAPEQWAGRPVPASDQYALAIMTYQLLTGQRPFTGTLYALLHQHRDKLPEPPGIHNPHVSPVLDGIILRGMAKDPDQRFPSVMAFAQAVQRAIQKPSSIENKSTLQYSQMEQNSQLSLNSPLSARDKTYQEAHQKEDGLPVGVAPEKAPSLAYPAPEGPTSLHQAQTYPEIHQTPPLSSPFRSAPQAKRGGGVRVLIICLLVVLVGLSAALGFVFFNQNNPWNGQNLARQTETAQTATAEAVNALPYPPHNGSLIYTNELATQTPDWELKDENDGGCHFRDQAYHVIEFDEQYFQACYAEHDDLAALTNFALEINLTIFSGNCGGIVLGEEAATQSFYYVRICQDGTYRITRHVNDGLGTAIAESSDPAIIKGFGQSNKLAIVIQQQKIALYINDEKVELDVDIPEYGSGKLALVASLASGERADVEYKNVRVWRLK